jgi:hypothetical protein
MSEFNEFNDCNCCDSGKPPEIGFYFAFRNKNIKSEFCGGPQEWILSNYHSLLNPENITIPPYSSPVFGELHADISISYLKTTNEEIEPSEGICFDTAGGGYSDTSTVFNYTRSTNPDLRVAFRDSTGSFYRKTIVEQEVDPETGELVDVLDEEGNTIPVLDENGEPDTEKSYKDSICLSPACCSAECGSPANPFLEGNTLRVFESLSKLTTTGGGGCGANYLNFCGPCDPPQALGCSGDGTTPITLDLFDKEVYTTNTEKGCRIYPPRPGTYYPLGSYATTGTYTREQKSTANCCFAFVCQAQVQQHPGEETTENIEETYDSATFPPLDEYISAQLGEPTLIEDIIAQTDEFFMETPYAIDETSLWYNGDPSLYPNGLIAPVGSVIDYSYPSSVVSSSRILYSSPFSESGYGNFCQLDLSAAEYRIAFLESPGTCYCKLWFVEEFLPSPIPEDWPIDPFSEWPQPQTVRSFVVEHTFATTANKSCFVELSDRGSLENPSKNLILSDTVSVLEPPTTSGTKFVRLRKYSYVEGYEPNDPFLVDGSWSQGCKPNGFPINPATETCEPELSSEIEPEP